MVAVPIHEAAERLGISVVAVRKRAQRGSLTAHKRDGVWYIEIEDGPPTGPPVDRPRMDKENGAETLALLRETVATLREQLSVKDQQIADLSRQGERLQSLLGNEQETTHRLLAAGSSAPSPPSPEPSPASVEDTSPAQTTNAPQRGVQRVQDGVLKRILNAVTGGSR